ncbi:hypothetical protein [Calycomorphotria hydatis]|uniref:Uncharacterized protein n=1 Tax=Calycomorphotria hydatis TaxID=2528027 RepID=A0A517TBY5_9PLAN|nr:hypothetical protein [Calycomorphotria hydatis]QDT65895.1 hypothetical protein V22_31580 [Calycomorphotria hydatis]
MDSSTRKLTVKPALIGAISIICLIAGACVFFVSPDALMVWGGLIRAGVLVGAIWLALPTKNREAAWARLSFPTVAITLVMLFLVVYRPAIGFPLMILLLIVRFVLQPPRKLSKRRGTDQK